MVRRNMIRRPARLVLERLEDRTTPSTGGLLDPTFGTGGHVLTSFSNNQDEANAVVVQPDGKTVIAGRTTTSTGEDFLVARYNVNGTLDTSFGAGGSTATDFSGSTDYAFAIALQPQADGTDKILAAGMATTVVKKTAVEEFAVARFNANGTLDTTFGTNGKMVINVGGNGYAESMAVDSLGRVVLAGFGANGDAALVRLTANGALDTTFGSGGTLVTNIALASQTRFDAVALQADGKIVLAGTVGNPATNAPEVMVARFTSTGAVDTTFGSGGMVKTQPGTNDHFGGVAIDANGDIVVSASQSYSPHELFLLRYTTTGALDPSFGAGGIATLVWPGAVGTIGLDVNGSGVAIEADGKIVVAAVSSEILLGSSQWPIVVARVNPNGSLDTGYGASGWATVQAGYTNFVNAIAIGPDGRLVLAGYTRTTSSMFPYDVMLARFLASAPQIGSFTASANPVPSGSSETLTVSNITDGNPNNTITQVKFYYIDGSGAQQVLGYGTQTSPGVWTLTFTVGLPAGSYSVFAQAEDSYGVLGDPIALSLQVM